MSEEQSRSLAHDAWVPKLPTSGHGYIIINAKSNAEAIETRA